MRRFATFFWQLTIVCTVALAQGAATRVHLEKLGTLPPFDYLEFVSGKTVWALSVAHDARGDQGYQTNDAGKTWSKLLLPPNREWCAPIADPFDLGWAYLVDGALDVRIPEVWVKHGEGAPWRLEIRRELRASEDEEMGAFAPGPGRAAWVGGGLRRLSRDGMPIEAPWIYWTDNRVTWHPAAMLGAGPDDGLITQIVPNTADRGIAFAKSQSQGTAPWYTSDGGRTWRKSTCTPSCTRATSLVPFGVTWTDRDVGWILDFDGRLRRTPDGGASWSIIHDFGLPGYPAGDDDPWFPTRDDGFVIRGDTLRVTADGGKNWETLKSPKHMIRGWCSKAGECLVAAASGESAKGGGETADLYRLEFRK